MATETDGFTDLTGFTNGPGSFNNCAVSGGALNPAAANVECGIRRISTFGADQYSQIDLVTDPTGTRYPWGGPLVRINSTTDGDCYAWVGGIDDGYFQLMQVTDNGSALSWAQIGTNQSFSFSLPDTARLQVTTSGSNAVLSASINGGTAYVQTDSSGVLASGQPGAYAYQYDGTLSEFDLDNWEGGDIGTSSVNISGIFKKKSTLLRM